MTEVRRKTNAEKRNKEATWKTTRRSCADSQNKAPPRDMRGPGPPRIHASGVNTRRSTSNAPATPATKQKIRKQTRVKKKRRSRLLQPGNPMGPAPKQPRHAQDQVPPQPETRQNTNTTHDTAHAPPPRAKKSKTPQNKKGEKRRTVCHGCTFLAVPTTGIKTLSTDAWIH